MKPEQMSYMTLRRHARVEQCGIPELIQAVRNGKVTVSAAAELTYLSPAEQLAQLNEHLRYGGGDHRKWMGSYKLDRRVKRMTGATGHGMRTVIRSTPRDGSEDDMVVMQMLALTHRLRELSGKVTAKALYTRVSERLIHNLDLSLEQATDFLICLRDAHRDRPPKLEMPKKTAE